MYKVTILSERITTMAVDIAKDVKRMEDLVDLLNLAETAYRTSNL